MSLPSRRLWFLFKYLNLAEATGDPGARWEDFQVEHLNNQSLLSIENKARQVGWSWTTAAGAVADAVLEKRAPNIFVSVNQEEATEKVRYARYVIEAVAKELGPKLIIDNRLELEFENGSRLISHPCRPVRGKAKANVILDEFAHYPKDKEIYAAALPVTSRGGRLMIGSSPLGAGGVFWEIYEQKFRPYPGFKRGRVPWWSVSGLCREVEGGQSLAPFMATEERVRAFGTARLVEIFENMPSEDFQQEYECAWVDEAVAWISCDEIKRNHFAAKGGGFGDQRGGALRALANLPVTQFLINRNGLGMQIAEELERFSGKAQGVDFTNATKELWSVDLKVGMQRGQVPLPLERELSYQIHSIKKKVTAAKNAVFDTEGNEKHHPDRYRALALAAWAAGNPAPEPAGAMIDDLDLDIYKSRRGRRRMSGDEGRGQNRYGMVFDGFWTEGEEW